MSSLEEDRVESWFYSDLIGLTNLLTYKPITGRASGGICITTAGHSIDCGCLTTPHRRAAAANVSDTEMVVI